MTLGLEVVERNQVDSTPGAPGIQESLTLHTPSPASAFENTGATAGGL